MAAHSRTDAGVVPAADGAMSTIAVPTDSLAGCTGSQIRHILGWIAHPSSREGYVDTTQIIITTVIVVAVVGGILAVLFRRRQTP